MEIHFILQSQAKQFAANHHENENDYSTRALTSSLTDDITVSIKDKPRHVFPN